MTSKFRISEVIWLGLVMCRTRLFSTSGFGGQSDSKHFEVCIIFGFDSMSQKCSLYNFTEVFTYSLNLLEISLLYRWFVNTKLLY